MISAVFRRKKSCFCAESCGKAAGAAESCQRCDGRDRLIGSLHKVDAPGDAVIVQIFRNRTSGHLTEKAAAVFPAHRNPGGEIRQGQRSAVVLMDIVQKDLKTVQISCADRTAVR